MDTQRMDQKKCFEEDGKPKFFTRSTARHLRRKRLNEARKAEKRSLDTVNGVETNDAGIFNEKSEVITKSKARRLRKKNKERSSENRSQPLRPYDSVFEACFPKQIKRKNYEPGSRDTKFEDHYFTELQNTHNFPLSVEQSPSVLSQNDVDSHKCSIVKTTTKEYCIGRLGGDNANTDDSKSSLKQKRKTEKVVKAQVDIKASEKKIERIKRSRNNCSSSLSSSSSSLSSSSSPSSSSSSSLLSPPLLSSSLPITLNKESLENERNPKVIDTSPIPHSVHCIYQENKVEEKGELTEPMNDTSSSSLIDKKIQEKEEKGIESYPNPPVMEKPKDVGQEHASMDLSVEQKSREEVKAEREAKKAARAAAKAKAKIKDGKGKETSGQDEKADSNVVETSCGTLTDKSAVDLQGSTKSDDTKSKKMKKNKENENEDVQEKEKKEGKGKAELRAERRAKQETQRMAKRQSLEAQKNKKETEKPAAEQQARPDNIDEKDNSVIKKNDHEVKLFKHLYHERNLAMINVYTMSSRVHPTILRLGVQYATKMIVGSNARCVALLTAIKQLIQDFERPSHVDFIRGLEASLQESAAYLHHCRPLAVSMQNALRHLKWQMTQLPSALSDKDAKHKLGSAIDTYISEQIQLAGKAISITIQTKISDGNVILIYGYSSLIHRILLDAYKAGKKFRVIVVDGRPWLEGKEQLRRLAKHGIECTYILINALSFIMPEVSKVFLGAHAILANGAVMSRAGTAEVALMARAYNVPVLVACETHKSCERVQTDSIVYNELGNANELARDHRLKKPILAKWQSKRLLNLLNITYDVTPADLVTAVVTELAILPCTSVPVILRIKPSEI